MDAQLPVPADPCRSAHSDGLYVIEFHQIIKSGEETARQLSRLSKSSIEAVSPRISGGMTTTMGRSRGKRFVNVVIAVDAGVTAAIRNERPVPMAALRTPTSNIMAILTDRFPFRTPTYANFMGSLNLGCRWILAGVTIEITGPGVNVIERSEPARGSGSGRCYCYSTMAWCLATLVPTIMSWMHRRPGLVYMEAMYRIKSGPEKAKAMRKCGSSVYQTGVGRLFPMCANSQGRSLMMDRKNERMKPILELEAASATSSDIMRFPMVARQLEQSNREK